MAASAPPLSLADKFTVEEGKIFLTGIQALVRIPVILKPGQHASVRADLPARNPAGNPG